MLSNLFKPYSKVNVRTGNEKVFLAPKLMLDQWFSTGGSFAPRGHLTMSKDIFFIVMTGEAAAASKHHIIHRIALYNRESFSLLLER